MVAESLEEQGWFILPSLSHGILLCPAASSGLIFVPVRLVHVSYFRHEWVIGVGVRQQGTYGQQDLQKVQFNRILLAE